MGERNVATTDKTGRRAGENWPVRPTAEEVAEGVPGARAVDLAVNGRDEIRGKSCFAMEGAGSAEWSGAGASAPLVNEAKPSL